MDNKGAESVWDALRATRWRPPAPASRDLDRRQTYVAALEQAEQLFRAAAGVGVAARPLLLFYGLSQAGRAVAAAAARLKGDQYRLAQHGIKACDLDGDLPDIRVEAGTAARPSSFVRLSELLDSPVWDKSVPPTLNELWDMLPENRLAPLADRGEARRTPLYVVPDEFGEPHPLATAAVVNFPPWVMAAAADTASAVRTYLGSYPGAQEYDRYWNTGTPEVIPELIPHHDGWAELRINWKLPDGTGGDAERVAFFRSKTRSYKGSMFFFPSLGGGAGDLHPLMAWWAVLYVLSMLARYQPAQWMAHIDINASPYAGAVEKLLKQALHIIPALIAETIEQVSKQSVTPR